MKAAQVDRLEILSILVGWYIQLLGLFLHIDGCSFTLRRGTSTHEDSSDGARSRDGSAVRIALYHEFAEARMEAADKRDRFIAMARPPKGRVRICSRREHQEVKLQMRVEIRRAELLARRRVNPQVVASYANSRDQSRRNIARNEVGTVVFQHRSFDSLKPLSSLL